MKVLILGIDALDRILLDRFKEQLPNLSQFRLVAKDLPVVSTFPPDSDTAWATIQTGLNPAQHGIVKFIDPLVKSYQILNKSSENKILQGKTFWELASEAGYATAAIFPHMCYPLWTNKSTMVVRGSSAIDVQANPVDLLKDYPNPEIMMGVRGFPERNLTGMQAHFNKLCELTKADAEFAFSILKRRDWDLFFVYWSTIDAVGHFFWNYYDQEDPNFVEGHPLQNAILMTYQIYDEIVGRFLAQVDENTTVIILSDHGHGARPFKLVSVNEILKQAGFLIAKDVKRNPHLGVFESGKRLAIQAISRLGLGKQAGKIMHHFPGVIQTFTRPSLVDWAQTVACATDMSGIKSYPYGGILINRANLLGHDYETVRSEIITCLQRACVLPDGTSLLRFIARREDLYNGPYIDKYPDIVFEFIYGYGVGWAINVPLFTQAASYNLVPGSHRGDTGSCFIRTNSPIRYDEIDLLDVVPTVLKLLSLDPRFLYDGKSILE